MHQQHYTQQELQSLFWKVSGAWQGTSAEKIPTQKALESLSCIIANTAVGSPLHVQAFDLRRNIIHGEQLLNKSPETQATTSATILAFPSNGKIATGRFNAKNPPTSQPPK